MPRMTRRPGWRSRVRRAIVGSQAWLNRNTRTLPVCYWPRGVPSPAAGHARRVVACRQCGPSISGLRHPRVRQPGLTAATSESPEWLHHPHIDDQAENDDGREGLCHWCDLVASVAQRGAVEMHLRVMADC